jgi:hypothetical protein
VKYLTYTSKQNVKGHFEPNIDEIKEEVYVTYK